MNHLILAFLLIAPSIDAQVLIMTYVYNKPEFIELHDKTFKAFFKDPYEYVVFNDAPNQTMCNQVEQTCDRLGIRCFRVPPHANNRQTPNYRHMDGIKHSLNLLAYNHDDIVMMVDADMFLIKPFSARHYLEHNGYDFVGDRNAGRVGRQERIVHSSPAFVIMNMPALPNRRTISFEGDRVEGVPCDVGGHTYYYFKQNPAVRVHLYQGISTTHLPLEKKQLASMGYDEGTIDFLFDIAHPYGMQFHCDHNFLHYYAGGSNWCNMSATYIREKDQKLYRYMNRLFDKYGSLR